MSMQEQYESKTGESATYRKNASDYHTLRYVRWLESRLAEEITTIRARTIAPSRQDTKGGISATSADCTGIHRTPASPDFGSPKQQRKTDTMKDQDKTKNVTSEGTSESTCSAVCSVCGWTNVSLLNLGEPDRPRMVCHGCCKRTLESVDAIRMFLMPNASMSIPGGEPGYAPGDC